MQQRQRGCVWPQHDNWIVRSLVFMIVLTLALLAVALQALPTTASSAGHLDLAASCKSWRGEGIPHLVPRVYYL
jgi:hypothetical protein